MSSSPSSSTKRKIETDEEQPTKKAKQTIELFGAVFKHAECDIDPECVSADTVVCDVKVCSTEKAAHDFLTSKVQAWIDDNECQNEDTEPDEEFFRRR